MAFNGSGTFNRLYNWATDKANGIKILASRMDGEMDGFATGLSTCITKDGQTTITAAIPFNAQRITDLGDATGATDAVNRQTGDSRWANRAAPTSSGASSPYVLTSTTVATLTTGARITFYAHNNLGASASINVNSLGAKKLRRFGVAGEADLNALSIVTGGLYEAVYHASADSGNGGWIVLNPTDAGRALIASAAPSGSSQAAFTNIPSGFTQFEIVAKLSGTTSQNVVLQYSTDNGSSFVASLTYKYHYMTFGESGTSAAAGSGAADGIIVGAHGSTTLSQAAYIRVSLMRGAASTKTEVIFDTVWTDNTGVSKSHRGGGIIPSTSWNALRLVGSSSTFSGTVALHGVA